MPEAFSDHTVYQESTGDWVLLYVAMRPLVEFISPEIIIFFKSSNIAKGTFAKIIRKSPPFQPIRRLQFIATMVIYRIGKYIVCVRLWVNLF